MLFRSLLLGALTPAALLGQSTQAPPRPRLVVLVVVDQLRADLLLRYRAEWTGGFRRLLDGGIVFPNGWQDHAVTQTAPGHSTLLSGRYPAHTGIPTNDLGVPDTLARLIGDTVSVGASPRKFLGTTLADWLLANDSTTRVLSVARKDRGAILPVGRSKEQVFWWSYHAGIFTASRYYRDSLPTWVTAWNARNPMASLRGKEWWPLLPEDRYPEPDSLPAERGTDGRGTFPHRLTDTMPKAASAVVHYPWMDSITVSFALAGVEALALGQRGEGRADLLSVSFATVDEVGHDFGPDSREMHDALLRLDGYLATLFDSLAVRVPAGEMFVVLASDHGAQPVPEQAPPGGTPARRASPRAMVRAVNAALAARWRVDFGIRFDMGLITGDVAALRARGIDPDSVSRVLAKAFAGQPYVDRTFTPKALAAAPASDRMATLWRRTIPAGFGWLLAVVPMEGTIWTSTTQGADHGTPWAADRSIPIVFWGGGITPGTVTRSVRSVDIAPTLARLLGVRPSQTLDGVNIPEVKRGPR